MPRLHLVGYSLVAPGTKSGRGASSRMLWRFSSERSPRDFCYFGGGFKAGSAHGALPRGTRVVWGRALTASSLESASVGGTSFRV